MNEAVLYEMNGGIATITLNRPEQLNSMSPDLLGGALTALEEASSNDAVRIVVLTGAGRAFCAGGDLGGMAEGNPGGLSGDGSTQTLIHQLRHAMMTSQLLHDMPKVTIAAINGPCAGAGLAWACACDIRICSERAVFDLS
jgi:2-(1,2-epoxy-1,2-dihydrophenyl)acetyl-CoA isomerase